MKSRIGTALWGLAVCALGTSALRAEDPAVEFAFKLRAQISHPSKDDGMTNGIFGHSLELGPAFGLAASYPLGPGRISAELGYAVQTGDEYLADLSGMQRLQGTTIDPATSLESRKNKLDGMTLRIGYEAPWTGAWSWRAGLQFGGNKFTHQVIGNINGTNGDGAYADSYYFTGTKSSMTPSPYGGVTLNINDSSALELGVLLLSYKALDYQHVAGTAPLELYTLDSKSRLIPNLEVAYSFRF